MLLNGAWQCRCTDGGAHDYEIPATVPGCVHTDLQAAGILGDLYYRDNADSCQWVERCSVTYTRTFDIGEFEPNTYLTFDGLDVYCDVFLNGKRLGSCDDMFIKWSFCTDGILKKGTNTLTVAFRSPVKETENLPKRNGAFTTERLYTRRVQCTYGWDWVARFVTMGIWKDVHLDVRNPDRLENVYVSTKSINRYSAQIMVSADFCDITGEAFAEFEILDPDGKTVYTKKRRLLSTQKGSTRTCIEEHIDIAEPRLWYPSGHGEQPLYTLKVGEREVRFGIRTVEILEIEDIPGSPEAEKAKEIKQYDHLIEWDKNEGSSSFILLVNGERIFCRGANWVPCEPFMPAETDEKIDRLVKLAKESNVNMLRVWGGGIFEHDAFYSACDREGILVTQDFLMACGTYPEEDDEFIRKLALEAEEAAYSLRNHPCLVWWSGDNENAVNGSENMAHYNGRRAALEGIGPVLKRLDPARRFLPSSPYGGVPYASAVRGTTHNTQFLGNFFAWVREGDFTDYRAYFERYLARFTAEQPALGMPYVSSLRKFMTDEDIFGDDTSISEYHTKNNPGLGSVTLYGYAERMAEGIFGKFTSGKDRVKKMQLLQCEWIRLSLELFRRNMWFSSGIIYWMFNDCWPAANGWSMVDYYTAPKPAFYTFKRCASDVIGSVTEKDGKITVAISNAGTQSVWMNYRLYVYNIVTGEETDIRNSGAPCPAGSVKTESCEKVPLDADHVLLLDLSNGDRSFFLPLRWADMHWKDSEPIVEKYEDSYIVKATETIPVLLLDVEERLDKNGMFLKKGETVTLNVIQ